MTHENLQQRKLGGGQADPGFAAPDLTRGRIQSQITHLQDRRSLRSSATKQGAQSREQLHKRKRLRQIVISTAIQARYPILDRIARGKHQHRRPHPLVAHPPARLKTIDPRQHHIKHNRAVAGRRRHPQRVLAASRDIAGKTLRP